MLCNAIGAGRGIRMSAVRHYEGFAEKNPVAQKRHYITLEWHLVVLVVIAIADFQSCK